MRFSCRCNGARGLSVETGERGIGLEQGGAPMWCVKRRWVVSWLVGGRRLGVVEGSISDHGALEPLVAAVGDAPCHGSMSRSGV